MAQVQKLRAFGFAAAAVCLSLGLQAQVGDPATLIKEKLVSQIKLSKGSAAHDDIVTAGDVVLLHKDGLMMCSSAAAYVEQNVYKAGVLSVNMQNRAKDAAKSYLKGKFFGGGASITDAANNGCSTRKFVSGEKFWITDIELKNNAIVVSTLSDPYNDVRYYGEIQFPFTKGAPIPPVDDFVKTVNEVITVAPSDDKDKDKGNQNDQAAQGGQGSQQQSAAAAPAAPAAPLQAIAPPPPPADAPPPTIAVGQTKDQVVAGFGQPVRTAKLAGTKEIYFYKDMKVTFTNGKVSNVE
jgi:hypothetical protein